jgi:hypothetical protein
MKIVIAGTKSNFEIDQNDALAKNWPCKLFRTLVKI